MAKALTNWLAALLRARFQSDTITEEQAADIGLSLSDLAEQARARPGVREQMLRMAARYGLSERDVNDTRWAAVDIARTCARCGSANVCLRYLDGKPTTFVDSDCPNAAIYAELSGEADTDTGDKPTAVSVFG